jgi:hypothetical protein
VRHKKIAPVFIRFSGKQPIPILRLPNKALKPVRASLLTGRHCVPPFSFELGIYQNIEMNNSEPILPLDADGSLLWLLQHKKASQSIDDAKNDLHEVKLAYSIAVSLITKLAKSVDGKLSKSTVDSIKRGPILAGLISGITLIEYAILGGYNTQAVALLRQEYEAIAALEELKSFKREEGKTPNIKSVKSIPSRIYGQLSNVAHFSHTESLRFLTELQSATNTHQLTVLYPQYIPDLCFKLFSMHVLFLLHIADNQIIEYESLHGISYSNDGFENEISTALNYLISSGALAVEPENT